MGDLHGCLGAVTAFRALEASEEKEAERPFCRSRLSNVLPSVFQRRRSAEDELAMRGFLQEGDLISVSCTVHRSLYAYVGLGSGA